MTLFPSCNYLTLIEDTGGGQLGFDSKWGEDDESVEDVFIPQRRARLGWVGLSWVGNCGYSLINCHGLDSSSMIKGFLEPPHKSVNFF